MVSTLRLIGWEKGLQTVSLIRAIRECGDLSLSESKQMVESLLDGQTVAIEFVDLERMSDFRRIASGLGAICESEELTFRTRRPGS